MNIGIHDIFPAINIFLPQRTQSYCKELKVKTLFFCSLRTFALKKDFINNPVGNGKNPMDFCPKHATLI
jgi:hypothetical protein